MIRALSTLLLVALLATTLAACGKKASDVEPGEGMRTDGYPRGYPDSGTDPKGVYIPPIDAYIPPQKSPKN
jgi:hypothetical protein